MTNFEWLQLVILPILLGASLSLAATIEKQWIYWLSALMISSCSLTAAFMRFSWKLPEHTTWPGLVIIMFLPAILTATGLRRTNFLHRPMIYLFLTPIVYIASFYGCVAIAVNLGLASL